MPTTTRQPGHRWSSRVACSPYILLMESTQLEGAPVPGCVRAFAVHSGRLPSAFFRLQNCRSRRARHGHRRIIIKESFPSWIGPTREFPSARTARIRFSNSGYCLITTPHVYFLHSPCLINNLLLLLFSLRGPAPRFLTRAALPHFL